MLLACLAVLVGATVQSAAGFGMALIAGPALVAVLAPAEAVTTIMVLATTTTLFLLLVRRGSRPVVRWADVRVVALAAVPGLLVGVLVLAAVSKPALQLAVGVGVLLAVGLQVLRRAGRRPACRSQPFSSANWSRFERCALSPRSGDTPCHVRRRT